MRNKRAITKKNENFNNIRRKGEESERLFEIFKRVLKILDSVIVRGCSLFANHTVQCRREVYTNMDDWRHQKHKLDFRIRNLRHKLQEMIVKSVQEIISDQKRISTFSLSLGNSSTFERRTTKFSTAIEGCFILGFVAFDFVACGRW